MTIKTTAPEIHPAQAKMICRDILSKLPEKNRVIKFSGNRRLDQQVANEIVGFNTAITLTEQAIKEYFGVEND